MQRKEIKGKWFKNSLTELKELSWGTKFPFNGVKEYNSYEPSKIKRKGEELWW